MKRPFILIIVVVLLTSPIFLQHHLFAQAVDAHTVALWHFNEGSGTVLHDESPFHNDGEIHDCEWVPGKFGSALHFNGLTSYVVIPNSLSLKTEGGFTVEVWINPDTLVFDYVTPPDVGAGVILGNMGAYPDGGGYDFGLHTGQGLLFGYRSKNSPGYVTPGVAFPPPHHFYHLAVTYQHTLGPDSATFIKIYINGALVDSNVYSPPIHYDNTPFYYLGTGTNGRAVGGWGVREYHGIIDDIRISNVVRQPNEFGSGRLTVTPEIMNFGLIKVNELVTHNAVVSNASFYDTVHVDSITSTNPLFTTDNTPFVLNPISNHLISIGYTPAAAENDTGTIMIYPRENAGSPLTVSVSGKGFVPAPAPAIISVRDIIGDQGKQVRIVWFPSMYDGQSDSLRITQYTILRRVNEPHPPPAPSIRRPEREVFASGNSKYVVLDGELWDFVSTWPALHFDQYSTVAPTLYNVTLAGIPWSVFKIAATTASGDFFISDPDSGFSIDNIFPPPPGTLQSEFLDGKIVLSWIRPVAPDLEGYHVYRSTSPHIVSSAFNRIATTDNLHYTDSVITPDSTYYYIVTSFDSSGNESVQSNTSVGVHVLGVLPDNNGLPIDYVLQQNYPNPFNPSTQITYGLPERSLVQLSVFNVLGQKIVTLKDGVETAGYHQAVFDLPVASGIYFCRMEATDAQHPDRSFVKISKMVMMK